MGTLGFGAFTVAVMPGQRESRETALEASRRGFEVILHLPMQPLRYPEVDPGAGALRPGMATAEVARRLDLAIADVPGAKGLNNHMGSRATRDRPLMERLLREAKERELYFIDSRTSGRSVAYETARALRLRSAERSVFLDTERSAEFVRGQLGVLEAMARRDGSAIGIGHPFPETLRAIQEIVPSFSSRGIKLVFAGELAVR